MRIEPFTEPALDKAHVIALREPWRARQAERVEIVRLALEAGLRLLTRRPAVAPVGEHEAGGRHHRVPLGLPDAEMPGRAVDALGHRLDLELAVGDRAGEVDGH